jgi:F-type H+-transporting ATPase subunit epsilon
MRCDIVSVRRTVYSGEVSLVVVPGRTGELGIMPEHAPLMSSLKPGPVRVVETGGEETTFLVGGGLVEVMPHVVTILVDSAARAADFDEVAAKRAQEKARRTLEARSGEMDIAEAQVMLKNMVEQIQALERWRKRIQHR